ncbi:Histone H1.1 [Massospora cicadina]|nr:Histone H1.1 [Massospora cicadina]
MVAKVEAAHPKYSDMIKEAIKSIKDRKGASRQAITKYIETTYKLPVEKSKSQIRLALKRAVNNESLILQGARFKLNSEAKAAPKKKAAAKKPAAKKAVKKAVKKTPVAKKSTITKAKKPATKKPAAKKSTTPKTKKVAAKKPATKKATAKKATKA